MKWLPILLLLAAHGPVHADTQLCDCSCPGYGDLVNSATEYSTEQLWHIDQCGGACAIAWVHCDSAPISEQASASVLEPGSFDRDGQDRTIPSPMEHVSFDPVE